MRRKVPGLMGASEHKAARNVRSEDGRSATLRGASEHKAVGNVRNLRFATLMGASEHKAVKQRDEK